MEFKKRTTCPEKSNRFYYKDNIFYKCNYGLPNCTCYAWGRFYELTNEYPKLCTANAENWFKYTKDGYKRGQEPKLGAVIVWSKGIIGKASDGAGHVAVVEEIKPDGSIVTSNSAYNGSMFYLTEYKKGYKKSGYKFEGFIYLPIEFDNPIQEPTEITTDTYTVVKGDTLSGIGNRLGINWKDIASINNIVSPYIIRVGQVLTIPNTTEKRFIQINTKSGVWCRKGIGFKYAKYKVIPYSTKCELLEKNAGSSNGYKWDKIIYNGVEVYLPNDWNTYL